MKRTSIAFLCFVLISFAALAQQRIALREGIVIDPTQPVAYVMSPQGGIAAVDLISGATRWTSSAAAKPLALSGNRLISQVEPHGATNRFEIVALDIGKGGATAARSTMELPPGVHVSIGESLADTFTTTARPEAGDVMVTWSWTPGSAQGMNEDADRALDATKTIRRVAPATGGVRINPTTGAMTRAASLAAVPAASSTWILGPNERVSINEEGKQYESADGRHVLVSERVADDREWQKYRWSVYERATGHKLGETRSHISFAPFVVRGSTLVFETTPYTVGSGEEEPAKLRGVDLDTGRETWSVPLREVVYRGPMPP